ncbi:MAG: hypothetical protein COT73_10985 [Bdellovibrio sp. CG10_big_fil_rev_8_21_14_0_10_47_8]|nr:MAG: hypothetical protein COT73_10985 [Bdellovibrio sp. CG10_big_fil_rev_8_21_14_0_10_47_8]
MFVAQDLMNKVIPALSFDSTVLQAVEFFKTHPQNFAIVSASRDRLHGVLTEGNLMQVYLRYQNQPAKDSLIFYRDYFEPAQLVQGAEPFPEVVKKVMTAVGNRVFVIDPKGDMVGIITAKDILPYFSEELGKKSGEAFRVAADELKSQLYLYQSFFSKSPFMMHSVNHDGFIQMANEILHAVLGYEYGQLIGKTIFDLYPQESHRKAEAGIKTIFNQGYHEVVQSEMMHKSGHKVSVELISRALVDQYNNPVGTMTVSRPKDMKILLDVLPQI